MSFAIYLLGFLIMVGYLTRSGGIALNSPPVWIAAGLCGLAIYVLVSGIHAAPRQRKARPDLAKPAPTGYSRLLRSLRLPRR